MARDLTTYHQDGRVKQTTSTFYRGENAHYHPTDETLHTKGFLQTHMMVGLAPEQPFILKDTPLVPFGSCFASHIGKHLAKGGYNVLPHAYPGTYVSSMGDGMVNTFAILQQFEWAWENNVPAVELWHGYKAETFGYDEVKRRQTAEMFDRCDVFIITLGLSEVWFDELSSLVFWRAVPQSRYDETRHRFRVATVSENFDNLVRIHSIIRRNRPDAAIVFTLSPVPLTATFRNQGCVISNSASKAILRAALDEFMRRVADDRKVFYFPAYEIVTTNFMSPFLEDRKHPHAHVIDLNMAIFERYFCLDGPSDEALDELFTTALRLDYEVARDGHFAVPRTMSPKAGGAVPRPGEPESFKNTGVNRS